MTNNILSYFINKSPLYKQINYGYYLNINYNGRTVYILYLTKTSKNYEKNILKTKNYIETQYIRKSYNSKFKYKVIYYNNDNEINRPSETYIYYNFNNKNKYLIKLSIQYKYNGLSLYIKDIFCLNNCKYINKLKVYFKYKYKSAYILILNKYELNYYSNIFLILL
jgi:hypothetical protein